jgi:hypothetical protein
MLQQGQWHTVTPVWTICEKWGDFKNHSSKFHRFSMMHRYSPSLIHLSSECSSHMQAMTVIERHDAFWMHRTVPEK